jgi:hypothetical protein
VLLGLTLCSAAGASCPTFTLIYLFRPAELRHDQYRDPWILIPLVIGEHCGRPADEAAPGPGNDAGGVRSIGRSPR